jgi:hypothetical protein
MKKTVSRKEKAKPNNLKESAWPSFYLPKKPKNLKIKVEK